MFILSSIEKCFFIGETRPIVMQMNHRRTHKGHDKFERGHFTVVYSVTRPMNGSRATGDLVLIQTSQFLSCNSCFCDAN